MKTIESVRIKDVEQALKCAERAGRRIELARDWKDRGNETQAANCLFQANEWRVRANDWIESAGLPPVDFKGE